jgi:hypothetical protein
MRVRTEEVFIWLDTEAEAFVVEIPEDWKAREREAREWAEAIERGEYVNVQQDV